MPRLIECGDCAGDQPSARDVIRGGTCTPMGGTGRLSSRCSWYLVERPVGSTLLLSMSVSTSIRRLRGRRDDYGASSGRPREGQRRFRYKPDRDSARSLGMTRLRIPLWILILAGLMLVLVACGGKGGGY